ncbi:MAG: MFS transporter [Saprospiraceae bacterium]|nr:MFS transporter [Saprospiraceae bacterium]
MRNFGAIKLLLLANFISGVAQGISMISIPLYFANQNQSNWFNIIYTIITLISLFWSLYGGTLIDKFNRKKIFLVLNITNGITIGLIAFIESSTSGYTNYLAATVFALTFFNYNLHYPCFYAFMQEITEKENYNKIASYIEVQSQLASAFAGAGAALLIGGGISLSYFNIEVEPWTLSEIFALDACTYFIAFFIIFVIRYVPLANRTVEAGSVLFRLRVGYNYLKNHPYVFLFGVVTHSVFVVVLLHVFNLAPVYVTQHLKASSETYAISEIFYALGAIVAGISVHRIFKKMTFVKAIIIMTLISVLEFVFMICSTWISVFYIMTFLLGLTNAGIRVIRVSYLFKVLPNQIMGRANSIFFLSNALSRIVFLCIFSLAFFHHSGNVIYSFMILSVFMFITVVVLMIYYSEIALNKKQ